jgi:hypothetical protein
MEKLVLFYRGRYGNSVSGLYGHGRGKRRPGVISVIKWGHYLIYIMI